jgi:hypothetical protein
MYASSTNTGYLNIMNLTVSVGSCPIGGSAASQVYYSGYIDQLTVTMRVKTPCEILQDASLVVYYPFENTITDQGPNSIVGTLSSTGTSYVSGHTGNYALQLNATAAYYHIPSLTGLGISNQAFSIALWVKPTAVSGILVHVSSGANSNSSFFAIYAFYISHIGFGGWCIPFLGFSSSGQIIANVLNSSIIVVSATGPVIQTAPFWTHIAQTWSATNGLRLYINGYLYANVSQATTYSASGAQNYLTLGTVLNGTTCLSGSIQNISQYFGAIDEFYLYSRELNANEICQLASL